MYLRAVTFLFIFFLFIIKPNGSNIDKKYIKQGEKIENNFKNYVGFNFQILDLYGIKSSTKHKEEILYLLKELQPKFLRFPGGTIAEHYHWKNHLFFPNDSNAFEGLFKQNKHNYRNRDYINIDEFMGICRDVGAQPIIVINLFTGRTDEAVELVHYLNIEKKYGVKYFELGNDEYHWSIQQKNLTNESKSYGMPAEQYAELVQQYSATLKKTDNTILIGAITPIGLREDLIVKRNVNNWAEVVNKNAGKEIDWWSIHFYYFNKTREGLINYVENFDRITKLKEQLGIIKDKNNHLEFLITEWNTNLKLCFDPVSILYTANLFIQFSKEKVNGALYHTYMSKEWGLLKFNSDKTIFINEGLNLLFKKISTITKNDIGWILRNGKETVGIAFESKTQYWIMLINNAEKDVDFDLGNNFNCEKECNIDIINCATSISIIQKELKRNINQLLVPSHSIGFVVLTKL